MSMGSIRAAIKNYLAAQAIPGLNRVYQGMPAYIDPAVWNLSAQGGYGAIAYVHLTESSETRIATPYITGQKMVPYLVGIVVEFRYAIPVQDAVALNGDEWTTGLDGILEGLKAAVRADPRLGTGDLGDVFQAGQDQKDLLLRSQLPTRDEENGEIWVWSVLEAQVSENITA
jgi:hypothetical protein